MRNRKLIIIIGILIVAFIAAGIIYHFVAANNAISQADINANQSMDDNDNNNNVLLNQNQGTSSTTTTENISTNAANNTSESSATSANANQQAASSNNTNESVYHGEKLTGNDNDLAQAELSYDKDAYAKLAQNLVSSLYEYTNTSIGNGSWTSSVMQYVDQNMMISHPDDSNTDNDSYSIENILNTRMQSQWYGPLANYSEVASHVENVNISNVYASRLRGDIYPVVRLYITYTANSGMVDTTNNTWKSINRYYDMLCVWLTKDGQRVFMVTTMKSTVVDYDINHVLTEHHILSSEEAEEKKKYLDQTKGL